MAGVLRALITGRQDQKLLILVNPGDKIATMQRTDKDLRVKWEKRLHSSGGGRSVVPGEPQLEITTHTGGGNNK